MNNYERKLEELKEELVSDIDSIIEGTYIVEGKVSSKEDLMGYAMTLAKNAFGDEVDEDKVESIVDNAIEKSEGDWEEAAGIVTGSFNEQVEEECDEDEDEVDEEDSEEEITEAKYTPSKDDLSILDKNKIKFDKLNLNNKNTSANPKLYGSAIHNLEMRDVVKKYFKHLDKSEQAGMAYYIINNYDT